MPIIKIMGVMLLPPIYLVLALKVYSIHHLNYDRNTPHADE
jgi:hypothetical protein